MKPPSFRYAAPNSVDECVALRHDFGSESQILAGGQSLVPMMNLRLVTPTVLVDINQIEECSSKDVRPDGLRIGATVRQRELEVDAAVTQRFPLVSEAIRNIGHPQIRNRGTVVGSLVHNDPAAELPAVAQIYDAIFELRSSSGTRHVGAVDFLQPFFSTAIAADELVTEVFFPVPQKGCGEAMLEFARRPGDFATVGIGCRIVQEGGMIAALRLVAFGVGPQAQRFPNVEREAIGLRPQDASWEEIGRMAATEVDPPTDTHGSSSYRRHLVEVLSNKTLRLAWGRSTS